MCEYLLLITEGRNKISNPISNLTRVTCVHVACMLVRMSIHVHMWGIRKWMPDVDAIVLILYELGRVS